jgi:hypothetical protein
MERGGDDAHHDAALNPTLLEGEGASELNGALLQEGECGEAGEADAAAAATAAAAVMDAAAARLYMATTPADADVARCVLAERNACPLLHLSQALPDFFKKEVLERLDPAALTMLAQVGRPWLAAVLASGLPRLPKWPRVRLMLEDYCTSAERLAWARANGCPQRHVVQRL